VRVLELEHTWDWARPGPAAEERELYQFADEVGCRQLNVPMFTAGHDSTELVAGFAGLCDRAAAHDLQVGLEFLPFSAIRTVGAARRIVADADRPNGGLIVDLWHWFRSGARAGGPRRSARRPRHVRAAV
jgi:sugar phosphate isomerase/epimerase